MPISFNIVSFFVYSFIGYLFECCVLSIQYRKKIINRGFGHGPFCIIYGVGAMAAVRFLSPYSGNPLAVFLLSTTLATSMEAVTAILMIKCFGQVWWDYTDMKFNYKGIISLESSIAWGLLGIFFFAYLSKIVTEAVSMIPESALSYIAVVLVLFYSLDFIYSGLERIKGIDDEADNNIGRLRMRYK